MKKAMAKLKATSGETLTETLAALLVITFCSALLATMLSSAAKLNGGAIEQDKALYRDISLAEDQTGATTSGKVRIEATLDGNSTKFTADCPVEFYGDPASLTSYKEVP